jgi:hypothetical protein
METALDRTGTEGNARPGRRALAIAAFIGPWGFVVANASYAWMTRDGGSDLDCKGALAIAAAHGELYRYAAFAAMVGSLLMVPAAIGAMRLTERRAHRLGLIGGTLMAGGYIAYFAMNMGVNVTLAMAQRGDHLADYAKVLDGGNNVASAIWVFLLFVVGNLIGTFLLGLALLRSHAVPAWAAAGVLGWPVLHVLGLFAGTEWFEATGALAQAIGFAVVGATLLRRSSAVSAPAGIATGRAAPVSA